MVRVSLDMPREQHRQLKEVATRLGLSQREVILRLLERAGISALPTMEAPPNANPTL